MTRDAAPRAAPASVTAQADGVFPPRTKASESLTIGARSGVFAQYHPRSPSLLRKTDVRRNALLICAWSRIPRFYELAGLFDVSDLVRQRRPATDTYSLPQE